MWQTLWPNWLWKKRGVFQPRDAFQYRGGPCNRCTTSNAVGAGFLRCGTEVCLAAVSPCSPKGEESGFCSECWAALGSTWASCPHQTQKSSFRFCRKVGGEAAACFKCYCFLPEIKGDSIYFKTVPQISPVKALAVQECLKHTTDQSLLCNFALYPAVAKVLCQTDLQFLPPFFSNWECLQGCFGFCIAKVF